MDTYLNQLIDGLAQGSIYALIAVGYTVVYGVLRMIHFPHGEVFMVGIFVSLGAVRVLGVDSALPVVWLVTLLVVVLVVTMTVASVVDAAVNRFAYRPLRRRGAPPVSALISGIGVTFILQELFALQFGRDYLEFPELIENRPLFTLLGVEVRLVKVLVLVCAVVMMIATDQYVRRSRFGRSMRALAEDRDSASLMGIDVERTISRTFLLSGALAGVGAVLFAIFFQTVSYNVGFMPGLKGFTAAVLGGVGNLRGAFLGGLVLGVTESFGAGLLGTQWADVVAYGVLIVVLLVRPTGIFAGAGQKVGA